MFSPTGPHRQGSFPVGAQRLATEQEHHARVFGLRNSPYAIVMIFSVFSWNDPLRSYGDQWIQGRSIRTHFVIPGPLPRAHNVSRFMRTKTVCVGPDITRGCLATEGDRMTVESLRWYVPALAVKGMKMRPSCSLVALSPGIGRALKPCTKVIE